MKKVTKYIVSTAAMLILAGCMSDAEKLAMFQNQCTQFGFKQGTTQFAHCMQKQSNEYEKREIMQQQAGSAASSSAALQTIVNNS